MRAQPGDDAARRVEAEGRAAGEDEGVDAGDRHFGGEQRRVAQRRRAAGRRDARRRRRVEHDDADAGGEPRVFGAPTLRPGTSVMRLFMGDEPSEDRRREGGANARPRLALRETRSGRRRLSPPRLTRSPLTPIDLHAGQCNYIPPPRRPRHVERFDCLRRVDRLCLLPVRRGLVGRSRRAAVRRRQAARARLCAEPRRLLHLLDLLRLGRARFGARARFPADLHRADPGRRLRPSADGAHRRAVARAEPHHGRRFRLRALRQVAGGGGARRADRADGLRALYRAAAQGDRPDDR